MALKSFEVMLDVDLDADDERDASDVRQMIWGALTALSSDELQGAVIAIPAVRELRSDER